eukprot:1161687-Pelagomonas_calceolata.AAC.8
MDTFRLQPGLDDVKRRGHSCARAKSGAGLQWSGYLTNGRYPKGGATACKCPPQLQLFPTPTQIQGY